MRQDGKIWERFGKIWTPESCAKVNEQPFEVVQLSVSQQSHNEIAQGCQSKFNPFSSENRNQSGAEAH